MVFSEYDLSINKVTSSFTSSFINLIRKTEPVMKMKNGTCDENKK
jgi:hypothetical protein